MTEQPNNDERRDVEMHHREITLSDGRYMIFYTFGDDGDNANPDAETKIDQREDV